MLKVTVLPCLPVEKTQNMGENHGHPCNQNTTTIRAKKKYGKSFFLGGVPTYFLFNAFQTTLFTHFGGYTSNRTLKSVI